MKLKLDAAGLEALMHEVFPQVAEDFRIEALSPMHITLRKLVKDKHLRPGGTVSGPAMFMLADCAIYLVLLAMIGPKVLAVTTNCSIDFMRKPEAGRDLIAEARLLKLGKVLAVGDVLIFPEGGELAVARATLTYSVPPEPG